MITKYAEHHLSNLWRWKTGITELEPKTNKIEQTRKDILNMMAPFLNEMSVLEDEEGYTTDLFENLMINRIHMGQFRYGPVKRNNVYDYLSYAFDTKFEIWKKTGNDEMLVDIANLCWLEYYNDSGKVHRVLKTAMDAFKKTKRQALVALAHFSRNEFYFGDHPNKHFSADSDELNKSTKLNV